MRAAWLGAVFAARWGPGVLRAPAVGGGSTGVLGCVEGVVSLWYKAVA
jgi:hypothetical protein